MNEALFTNENFTSIIQELGITEYTPSANAKVLIQTNSRFLKDVNSNVTALFSQPHYLKKKEVYLIALAIAVNDRCALLQESLTRLAKKEQTSDDEIAEIIAIAAIMSTNNVYHNFRDFLDKDSYNKIPAGIKMSSVLNPVLGKELYELICIAVSTVNGCRQCVQHHERAIVQLGTSESRIFEAVKLASVIRSVMIVLS